MKFVLYNSSKKEYFNRVTKTWTKYVTYGCIINQNILKSELSEITKNMSNLELISVDKEIKEPKIIDELVSLV